MVVPPAGEQSEPCIASQHTVTDGEGEQKQSVAGSIQPSPNETSLICDGADWQSRKIPQAAAPCRPLQPNPEDGGVSPSGNQGTKKSFDETMSEFMVAYAEHDNLKKKARSKSKVSKAKVEEAFDKMVLIAEEIMYRDDSLNLEDYSKTWQNRVQKLEDDVNYLEVKRSMIRIEDRAKQEGNDDPVRFSFPGQSLSAIQF